MSIDPRSTPASARPASESLTSAQTPSRSEESSELEMTFEQAMATLQQIVQELERGELGLTDSLARYEQGVRCLKACYGQLESAERRIAIVRGLDEHGQPMREPFHAEDQTLEAKAAARGSRRSRQS